MGMAEKAAFMNGIEKRMAAVLTAEARDQALKAVSDALEEVRKELAGRGGATREQ